ncbi:hypothetical protein HanRHA438_Chr17g0821081 [Helianthus annuus]|nr:hypothetical protein HanRHA438_Chr17g0821081 [Helianthus annuus]
MGDLLAGYRKALNDTRFKFSEYRKRFALQEEPLYKDAGPGGLVLSTREIEKQRLKKQEEMMKFQTLAKNIEDEYVYQLEMQTTRLSPMVDKLVFIENEVQKLKEITKQPKETRDEPIAVLEPSVEPEETQKLVDEDELLVEPEKDQKSMDEVNVPLSLIRIRNQRMKMNVLLSPKRIRNQRMKRIVPLSPKKIRNQWMKMSLWLSSKRIRNHRLKSLRMILAWKMFFLMLVNQRKREMAEKIDNHWLMSR